MTDILGSPSAAPLHYGIAAPTCKIVCVMVGLPARGKTFIARKVARYLTWLGHRSRIFNVGNYRRTVVGAAMPSGFFDPDNEEFSRQRTEVAMMALDDMLNWLESDGTEDDGSFGSLSNLPQQLDPQAGTQAATVIESHPSSEARRLSTTRSQSAPIVNDAIGSACVALYDATNSTKERRQVIAERCMQRGIEVMFIESVSNDENLITANIREVKLSSPDYKGMEPEKAIDDFKERIKLYEKSYETLDTGEIGGRISFVKLIDVGNQVIVNRVRGYIQSRIVYFLMNLNTTPRSFFFSRHGESMFNVMQKIGGNSSLSPRGEMYAKKLPELLSKHMDKNNKLTVWTSTLKRTGETARYIGVQTVQWKQLDEIDSGVCDGLTYAEIEARFPADFEERDTDKFNYRYHGGESYRDLVHRLEPVIMELERHSDPHHTILVISHQAVLRCILAYFLNVPHAELPYVKVPLHTVMRLTPKAYGCLSEQFPASIPAVDTHRSKPPATPTPSQPQPPVHTPKSSQHPSADTSANIAAAPMLQAQDRLHSLSLDCVVPPATLHRG
eukprot:jgi/Hompol1/5245/HPOL_000658-RA